MELAPLLAEVEDILVPVRLHYLASIATFCSLPPASVPSSLSRSLSHASSLTSGQTAGGTTGSINQLKAGKPAGSREGVFSYCAGHPASVSVLEAVLSTHTLVAPQ